MTNAAPVRLLATGASNLARMALPLLAAARAGTAGPVEAHFVLGRGRSYGVRSSLLGRGLCGIRHAALWERLPTLPAADTTALLLDVGNDLLYGFAPEVILGWVDEVLQHLVAVAAHRHVVGLPLAAIERLGPRRFVLVRSVLVPKSRLRHADALAMSRALHEGLRTRAARHGATFHEPELACYGLDPVHVRRSLWTGATRRWLGVAATAVEPTPSVDGTVARWRFLAAAPHERTWFGRVAQHAQPVRSWRDGSSLSLW
ncbi:MAG: SGNH/GDSL hydrolase family protein [Planctomycetes bacterium]|nr:SGNH/GDSL hydrolase family protein [Planctomycetota bacterium]